MFNLWLAIKLWFLEKNIKKEISKKRRSRDYFYSKYSNLFSETMSELDFDIPDGWVDLFDDTLVRLHELNGKFKVACVKQKLGSLRIYLDIPTEEANRIVLGSESRSLFVCENCGLVDKEKVKKCGSNFIRTLCPKCFEAISIS